MRIFKLPEKLFGSWRKPRGIVFGGQDGASVLQRRGGLTSRPTAAGLPTARPNPPSTWPKPGWAMPFRVGPGRAGPQAFTWIRSTHSVPRASGLETREGWLKTALPLLPTTCLARSSHLRSCLSFVLKCRTGQGEQVDGNEEASIPAEIKIRWVFRFLRLDSTSTLDCL